MQVTLQLHPDRPYGQGTVLGSIARDGVYRNQFETGISGGGLTAHEGGERWRWESRLFGGRYDRADPGERPVYGALDVDDDPYGGSVRFGSAYLVLRPHVLERATFCFPDSVFEPDTVVDAAGVGELVELARASTLDPLDRYVEAHVHGGVSIARDVEAVVLDPCYRGTQVLVAAEALGCEVRFHPGFRVGTSALDPAYRGQAAVDLARSLGPVLTPDLIGRAARSGAHDGQELKRVWHLLARFGRTPADPDQMPAAEVVEIIGWLDGAGVVYQVNGGWGVDALVGRQTRPHRDLDLFLDERREGELLAWLASRGYRVVEDWRPVRVELAGERGRVDVHPMRIGPDGDGVQQGLDGEVYVHAAARRTTGQILGRAVVVPAPARVRELRAGYPPRDVDRHDLALLDDLEEQGPGPR